MTTRTEPDHPHADQRLQAIAGERRRLLNIAYRLTGSLAEAEDAVQETYARWCALSPHQQDEIESPAAWLTKVAGRVCLDMLRSARVRRERYVGVWLPEPLPVRTEWATDQPASAVGTNGIPDSADPADLVTLDESVNMAFLVVLESMTPAERVAFILHDVFAYPFAEIAEITDRTPAACRQLASSARRRVREARVPTTTTTTPPTTTTKPSTQHSGIVRDFKQAWAAKDISALISLLDPDATVTADGGGLVAAALHPVRGGEQIARGYVEISRLVPDMTVLECTVNGHPGLIAQQGGVTVTVYAFHIVAGRIKDIWAVRNPEKLRPWQDQPTVSAFR